MPASDAGTGAFCIRVDFSAKDADHSSIRPVTGADGRAPVKENRPAEMRNYVAAVDLDQSVCMIFGPADRGIWAKISRTLFKEMRKMNGYDNTVTPGRQ